MGNLAARLKTAALAIGLPMGVLSGTSKPAQCQAVTSTGPIAQLGPRPFYLTQLRPEGELKQQLQACQQQPFYRHDFSIGHRGAPLQFAEHSQQSYQAAIAMGAGIVECDVAFTADQQLIIQLHLRRRQRPLRLRQ